MPVRCVVRAGGIQRWERGVLVVSLELLIPTLRRTAGDALHLRAYHQRLAAAIGLALGRRRNHAVQRSSRRKAIVETVQRTVEIEAGAQAALHPGARRATVAFRARLLAGPVG